MTDAEHARIHAIVVEAVEKLGEYCDTVQIFCTTHLPSGDTRAFHRGAGNVYARIAQADQWVAQAKERWAEEQRREMDEEEDDPPADETIV